mmetsp:Transcript_3149/g.11368  ORF Transcript_3149/g.11368 Transcript_3149/m.11368 type:complete len:450 (-) Transcript_3149:1330-2679(-)
MPDSPAAPRALPGPGAALDAEPPQKKVKLEDGQQEATIDKDGKSIQHVKAENAATASELPKLSGVAGRDESLRKEEESSLLRFDVISNDGAPGTLRKLIDLKNIYSKQLPNMPKDYIVKLVFDNRHKSLLLVRGDSHLVGGITYRPFYRQGFGEIAFCAVSALEQVKGYGSRMMAHLKDYANNHEKLTHFLTYADNNAVGYFSKQGFSKEILFERENWFGYIKDYDGGTLMECSIDTNISYKEFPQIIRRQREAVDEKIKELSNSHVVYPGLAYFVSKKQAATQMSAAENGDGTGPKPHSNTLERERGVKIEDIPGVKEAQWPGVEATPPKLRLLGTEGAPSEDEIYSMCSALLKGVRAHEDAWPFQEPVDPNEVPDYYDVVKEPIDLASIQQRLESRKYYLSVPLFLADLYRMFSNCRIYNASDTIFYKLADRLEFYLKTLLSSFDLL